MTTVGTSTQYATTQPAAGIGGATATRAGALVVIACVGLIGLGLVWAAGFANASALHNAAHDSRHSLAFPCH